MFTRRLFVGNHWGKKIWEPLVFEISRNILVFIGIFYRIFGKFPDISYQSSPRSCVFQPGSKIMDLGFVKFKSNGTTTKRPLEQIQKTQGAKIKQGFWFCLGVLHGFSRKSNADELSRKTNGGWIFLGIKRGLQKNNNNNNNLIRLVPTRIEIQI